MIDDYREMLDSVDVTGIKNGYTLDANTGIFRCIYCEAAFEKGVIYPVEQAFYDAERAAGHHVEDVHGGALAKLLDLGKENTGISETQSALLSLMAEGISDKECARRLGGKSPSTIRNLKFQLRRRVREAKVLLAVMELVGESMNKDKSYVTFHGKLTVDDDRTIVTQEEQKTILEKAFGSESSKVLIKFPKKQKGKLVVLNRIVESFDFERRYTEKEVNEILERIFYDYVTLRRYLIEYGFLVREPGGGDYWRVGD